MGSGVLDSPSPLLSWTQALGKLLLEVNNKVQRTWMK